MRVFISFLITLIVIPLTVIITLLWITYSLFLNPVFIKSAVRTHNTYQKLLDATLASIAFPSPEDKKFTLNGSDKERILKAAVTPEELQQTADAIVDDFFVWLHGSGQTFSKTIDFTPHKNEAIQELNAIFKEKYAVLPECRPADLILMQYQSTGTFPTCRRPSKQPYESRYENFDPTPFSQELLGNVGKGIQLKIPANAVKAPTIFKYSSMSLKILTAFIAFLILSIVLLLRKTPKRLLRWLGIVEIIISLPILIPAYFGTDALNQELASRLNPSNSNIPAQFRDIISQIVSSIVTQFGEKMNLVGLAFLTLGILLIIISFFVTREIKKKPASAETPLPVPIPKPSKATST